MKKSIHLLLFILSSFTGFGQAAQIVGGSIRYEALDNNKYKVIANVNRLCNGEALQTPTLQVFTANNNFNLTLTRIKIEDVTLRCKNNLNPCNPQNTKTAEGIEQHTFEANIDFNTMPYSVFKNNGNCEVFFGLTGDKRSDSINTLTTKGNFYIEAMIDLCVLGNANNTSPTFNGDKYLRLCINRPFLFNAQINDIVDRDSFGIAMTKPMVTHSGYETYNSNYTERYPISPFCPPNYGIVNCKPLSGSKPPRGIYLDPLAGDLILTPTKFQKGLVCFKVGEYRKIEGVLTLIGYFTIELYADIIACSDNNPPYMAGNKKYSVCEGEKICFQINTSDLPYFPTQTTYDTVILTWDSAIKSAAFKIIDPTAREKQAQFCWQTKLGDSNPFAYFFTASATDNNCPNPGKTTSGFMITVKPSAYAARKYGYGNNNQLIFEAISPNNTQNYEWTIKDSTNKDSIYTQTYQQKDTFRFNKKGKYIVTLKLNNPKYNCPTTYLDTVIIDGRNTSNINDFTVKLKKIIVYPNPAKKIITIQINPNETYLKLKIYNAIGKEIYNGTMQQNINVSEFTNGIYTLLVESDKGIYTAQMIKE